jgi:hypothetical protein
MRLLWRPSARSRWRILERLFDIASGQDSAVPIKLVSDFDQLRERWVKTPMAKYPNKSFKPRGGRGSTNRQSD